MKYYSLILLLICNSNVLSMNFARRAVSKILKPKVLIPLVATYQLRNYHRRNREFDADKKAAIALQNVKGGINYLDNLAKNSPAEKLARQNTPFKLFFDFTKTHPYYQERIEEIMKLAQEFNLKNEEISDAQYENLYLDQRYFKLLNKLKFIISQYQWPNGTPNIYLQIQEKGLAQAIPFLYSILIPVNYLYLSECQLDFVLAHEVAHILQFEEDRYKYKLENENNN